MKITLTLNGKSVEVDLTEEQIETLGLKEEKGTNGYQKKEYYNPWKYPDADVSDLKGKTVVQITVEKECDDLDLDNDRIIFLCSDGSEYMMQHDQDCCESVGIESIDGHINDLLDSPIVIAEVVTSEGEAKSEWAESHTWTFYKFATAKGYVTIRWYGESNGYYSEKVSFVRVDQGPRFH